MPVISMNNVFASRPSFTDVVSHCTDAYAAVRAMPLDVVTPLQAGDVINATGSLWTTGDEQAFVVVSEHIVPAGAQIVNVLRAPNIGSWVALRSSNLNFATDSVRAEGIAFLEAQGFQTEDFHSTFPTIS